VLHPDYPIRTPRLLLRPLTAADADDLLVYQSDPDVCRYIPYEPRTRAEIATRLADPTRNRSVLDEAGQALLVGVEMRDGGRVIGDLTLAWISAEHRSGELGWVLDPAHQGRGYATEAVAALLPLAFDDLGLHRVVARIDARNTASAGVARRLGMRREAHLVENEWFKGGWSDELDFALLASEWRLLR
jgi:RimJ/RimL family protein N-acetyltransferase